MTGYGKNTNYSERLIRIVPHFIRYQTRSCTGLAVRALRKNKKAEDQRDDENPKQTSQIRAIYAAVSAV